MMIIPCVEVRHFVFSISSVEVLYDPILFTLVNLSFLCPIIVQTRDNVHANVPAVFVVYFASRNQVSTDASFDSKVICRALLVW